jgi:hypothetical protein
MLAAEPSDVNPMLKLVLDFPAAADLTKAAPFVKEKVS